MKVALNIKYLSVKFDIAGIEILTIWIFTFKL